MHTRQSIGPSGFLTKLSGVILLIGLTAAASPIPSARAQLVDLSSSSPQTWSPPDPEAVSDALADVKNELASFGETPSDAAVRVELERLVSILERQRTLLDELNAPTAPQEAEQVAPTEGAITIRQLDQIRTTLVSAQAQAEAAAARKADAQRALEAGAEAAANADRLARAAREAAGNSVTPEVALAEAQARAAQADLVARRIERRVADAEAKAATERAGELVKRVESANRRVRASRENLDDILAGIDRLRQDLDAQLLRAQSNLDFASERLLSTRRQIDERGREAPGLAEELAARTLWRDAYRRESEILAKAVERQALRRELWETRFRLHTEPEFRRSGNALSRLREIEAEIERNRRLLATRADEARAQLDRARASADDVADDGSDDSRWAGESRLAIEHRYKVLDEERSRLNGLAQLAAFAVEDAVEADRSRSLADRAREVMASIGAAWSSELLVIEDRSITVGKLVMGVVLLLAGLWIARFVARLAGRFLLPRMGLNEGAAAAVQVMIFYVLLVTIALFALRLINIPLTVFTVLGGALAIGIGFGSQNLMNNFISGLILLAERPIRVGDLIQIGELHGTVKNIGARSTRVLTPNNIDIIVPNSSFLESNVTNWTLTEDRVRVGVRVGVAYGSPTREVIRLMRRAADDHGKILDKPAPIVLFEDFGDNALAFELLVWIRMKRMMDRRQVESDLRMQMNELFNDAGIVVAFPQRDVHLDTARPLDVRVLPAAESMDAKAAD